MRSETSDNQGKFAEAPFSLAERVAWVTGSSRGIGRAIARAFARAGAHVVIHGRNPITLDKVVGELASEGGSASSVVADMTDEDAMLNAVEEVVSRNGRLDILVNNAGVAAREVLTETSSSDWRAVFETNLTSPFILAREAGRRMISRRQGRIINIASVAGLLAARGRTSYVASKHALIGLTRSLALELGRHGVTSNAIAPGFVATDMNADLRSDAALDGWVKARNPQARWGRPEDVAYAALFLASQEAGFINGAVLCVDGGMSAVVI